DAEPIPNQKKPAVRRIPQGDCEHPAEAIDGLLAPLFVRVDDDFRVAVRAERVTSGLEVAANVGEVVDLAVEDDPDRPVFVGERLIARREVDDAQAPMTQADALAEVVAVRVGPAMRDGRRHRRQPIAIDRLRVIELQLAGDSAHVRMRRTAAGGRRRHRAAPARSDTRARMPRPSRRTNIVLRLRRAPRRPDARRAPGSPSAATRDRRARTYFRAARGGRSGRSPRARGCRRPTTRRWEARTPSLPATRSEIPPI